MKYSDLVNAVKNKYPLIKGIVGPLEADTEKYKRVFKGEPVTAINLESDEYLLLGHKLIGESPAIRLGTSTSSHVCICRFKANTDYTIFFNKLPLTYYKIGYGTIKNTSLGGDRITFDNVSKTYEIKYNTKIHKFKKSYDGFLYLHYSDNGSHGVEMFEGSHDAKPLIEPGVGLNVYSRTQADSLIKDNHYTVSKTGTEFIISTPKTRYTFKKVTKVDINIDTWRLYKGELIDENGISHTMWQDADAEGAIKITGEDDFVSGFHGDEVMGEIKVFIDGVQVVDIAADFAQRKFRSITFHVTSTVYHCDSQEEAFARRKVLSFEGDTVKVQNHYKAAAALSVESARLALFQCNKNGSNEEQMFTHYSLNNDFMLHEVPTTSNPVSVPVFSKEITASKMYTKYADIECKINRGQGTAYSGGIVDFSSNNRMKVYFDSIHTTTSVAANEVLASEFEWCIR